MFNKEEVFKIIEEYETLKHENIAIKFPKKIKEEGIHFLLDHGFSTYGDVFTISKWVQRKLDKTKIKYKIVK